MIKKVSILFLLLGVGSNLLYAITPEEIIKKADVWRAPSKSFVMDMRIISYKDGKSLQEIRVKGYVKDIDKVMLRFYYPKSWNGRKILMLKKDMWIIFPNTHRPIRITPSQRLMGEIATGDVARVSFSKDYTATIKGVELVDSVKCYLLELLAKNNSITYNKVLYWVRNDNFQPLKAEFFALSGKKLKVAYYSEIKKLGGRNRVSKITIHDAIKKNCYTVLEYLNMKEKYIPNRYFNLVYLQRM